MTALLAILGTLAAGIAMIGLLYAFGAPVPGRVLAIAGLLIALAAGVTLVTTTARDIFWNPPGHDVAQVPNSQH